MSTGLFAGITSNVVKAAPERSVRDQILRQEIDERSHTLTGDAACGDSVQIGVGSHERVESGDKCARGKLLADIPSVSHDDAVAVERPLAKNAAIVGNAIARNTNRNRSSLNGERPRRKGRSRARVDEAIVRGQVLWGLGCCMVCPIGWRGAHQATTSKHKSSVESRIRQGA